MYFLNTLIIAIPAVIGTLWISSMLGFVFARFSFKANILLLMMFTAGNLLPQQVIIVPLYRLYLLLPNPLQFIGNDAKVLYDSYFGIVLIHIVFQTGFCTFVLSNYMKTISKDLTEAALVDGASLWMIYRKVVLPLCRPALAALAVLEFTFIYNDFFWALVLMNTGDETADHVGPEQPPGGVLHRPERPRRGVVHRGDSHRRGVPRAVQAVRSRPDPGFDQGLAPAHAQQTPAPRAPNKDHDHDDPALGRSRVDLTRAPADARRPARRPPAARRHLAVPAAPPPRRRPGRRVGRGRRPRLLDDAGHVGQAPLHERPDAVPAAAARRPPRRTRPASTSGRSSCRRRGPGAGSCSTWGRPRACCW